MRALAAELENHGANTTVIVANLGVCDAASRLVADLQRQRLVAIDVLVNNAGFGDFAPFDSAEPTKLAEMIQLNVATLTELTRFFLPGMIARRRGRVLLVAAVAGFAPGPGAAVYHATKAYVLSLGEAVAFEVRGSGVTVTTLCPGPTRTGFSVAAGGENTILYRRCKSGSDPAEVARHGYRAMRAGCRVVVPGLGNRIATAFLRFAPRRLVLSVLAGLLTTSTREPDGDFQPSCEVAGDD